MPTLYTYTKLIDAITTHQLRLPYTRDPASGLRASGQEIAMLPDGRTVVALDDGAELPADQPEAIAHTVKQLPTPLPAELRDQIRGASPQCRYIDSQMKEQIRARYAIDDEMYLARIGVGTALGTYTPSESELQALAEYQTFVEGVREWGRAQRAALGL